MESGTRSRSSRPGGEGPPTRTRWPPRPKRIVPRPRTRRSVSRRTCRAREPAARSPLLPRRTCSIQGARTGTTRTERPELETLRGVLAAEVDRDRGQQRPGPPVDRVEQQRLVIADHVRDQPDDKPDKGHAPIVSHPARLGVVTRPAEVARAARRRL